MLIENCDERLWTCWSVSDAVLLSNLDCMLTRTYREDITDYDRVESDFKEFRTRLRTLGEFHYVATLERQQRGAIHIHVACSTSRHGSITNMVCVSITWFARCGDLWLDGITTTSSWQNRGSGRRALQKLDTPTRDLIVFSVLRISLTSSHYSNRKKAYGEMMQLELFEREIIGADDMQMIFQEIRPAYWFLRNTRPGRYGDAKRRRFYRKIAVHKRRLLLSGADRMEILNMLSCYRLKCRCATERCRYFWISTLMGKKYKKLSGGILCAFITSLPPCTAWAILALNGWSLRCSQM